MKLHYTKLCVIWPTYLHVILLFPISLLHLQTANIVAAPTNETNRLALLKFKALIGNDPHKILSSWNDSIHFCNWQGVTCSRQHQRVTTLDLKGFTLRGSISPYVGNLSDNFLYGEIPQEVTHLSHKKCKYIIHFKKGILGILLKYNVIPPRYYNILNYRIQIQGSIPVLLPN